MNGLSVNGGSQDCAECRSHYDYSTVTLGDPPEPMSE
jgi:hypothetical protein